jgi:hypothetical protein
MPAPASHRSEGPTREDRRKGGRGLRSSAAMLLALFAALGGTAVRALFTLAGGTSLSTGLTTFFLATFGANALFAVRRMSFMGFVADPAAPAMCVARCRKSQKADGKRANQILHIVGSLLQTKYSVRPPMSLGFSRPRRKGENPRLIHGPPNPQLSGTVDGTDHVRCIVDSVRSSEGPTLARKGSGKRPDSTQGRCFAKVLSRWIFVSTHDVRSRLRSRR